MSTTLRMFDFDGTLFRSPGPPSGWSDSVSWYGQEMSLRPPAVPLRPSVSWWIGPVVDAARQAFDPDRDLDTAFLVTGRWPIHANRIRDLLRQIGIDVPAVHCKPPETDTVRFKTRFLARATDTGAGLVEVWEDFPEYLDGYRRFVEDELGIPFIGHLVRYPELLPAGPIPSPGRVAERCR